MPTKQDAAAEDALDLAPSQDPEAAASASTRASNKKLEADLAAALDEEAPTLDDVVKAVSDPKLGRFHVGNHPQNPNPLEVKIARSTGVWSSFKDLPREAGVMQRADGTWYRLVQRHSGASRIHNGVLQFEIVYDERKVALSLDQAKAAGADYWNGRTWIRNGTKPEAEAPENSGASLTQMRDWEDASPVDTAVARQAAMRAAAMGAAIPETRGKG